MQVSNPVINTVNSTGQIQFQNVYLRLYRVKIEIINNIVDTIITIYDNNGFLITQFPLKTSMELEFLDVNYSLITFQDSNNYMIYYSYQFIDCKNEEEYNELKSKADIRLVPISNVQITSPLDSWGNVSVNQKAYSTTIFNGTLTANTSWDYSPVHRKISVLIDITSVSGTSPTLDLDVYAIDTEGNVLSSDAIASASFTATGQQILMVDLYGVNNIQISATVGGTSPSFTCIIGVEE